MDKEIKMARLKEYEAESAKRSVDFMHSLLLPEELLRRITRYVDEEVDARRLPARSMQVLREVFIHREMKRNRAPEVTGYQERRARQVLAELISKKLLVPHGPRAPVRLGFPLDVVE